MDRNKFPFEDRVFLAIEFLLRAPIVSVVDEANKYCYKTWQGEIGVVDKEFIDDRVNAGLIQSWQLP